MRQEASLLMALGATIKPLDENELPVHHRRSSEGAIFAAQDELFRRS